MKKIIKVILATLMLALNIYLVVVVTNLDVLPSKYYWMFIGVLILLNVVANACLFVKKLWPKVITVICYVIMGFISFMGINYGVDTLQFFNKAFNNNDVEVTTYQLIVLDSSLAQSIEDLDKKRIGYLSSDTNKDKVLDEVHKKVEFDGYDYVDIYELYDDFIRSKVDAVVLDLAFIEMLEEEMSTVYDCIDKCSFKDDYRVLYSFNIETKKEMSNKNDKLEPFNLYISGSDSRSNKIQNNSRSDVNMVLTINPVSKTVLMTSIPRDYYVYIHGKTTMKDKLTHAGIYGLDVSRQTVEDLFDVDIAYSIKVGMSSVKEMVDLVGGIDVYSDTSFTSSHIPSWHIKKGMVHMNGEQALAYSRERYAYASGDRHRILNQQQVLEATLKKVISDKTILTKYDKLLDSLANSYRTDIPSSIIKELVKRQLDDMSGWEFITNSVSGSDASSPTYTAPNSKRYVMIPYEDDVKNAHDKIVEVLNRK